MIRLCWSGIQAGSSGEEGARSSPYRLARITGLTPRSCLLSTARVGWPRLVGATGNRLETVRAGADSPRLCRPRGVIALNDNDGLSDNAVLPIPHILPFENRCRIFQMPAVRLIGKSIRDTLWSDPNPCPAFWSEYFAEGYHLVTDPLPRAIPNRVAWFGEYSPDTRQYTYMICVACPAGTPVPDGFEYRDVPAALVAHGTTNEAGRDAYSVESVDADLQEQGFIRVDEGWCEFYPDLDRANFCVLFTCRRVEKGTVLRSVGDHPDRSEEIERGIGEMSVPGRGSDL